MVLAYDVMYFHLMPLNDGHLHELHRRSEKGLE